MTGWKGLDKLVLLAIGLILMTGTGADAQSPMQIHKSELSHAAITAGDLKFMLTDTISLFGLRGIKIEIENLAPKATLFVPQQLSFVQADGDQIDLLVKVNRDAYIAPPKILLINGARTKQVYYFTDPLQLPARMYYQGQLIAEISN